jgi:sulfite reductase (NADPH) hemoprotein beta-component
VCSPRSGSRSTASPRATCNGTLRLTTRQTFQFHGVMKRDLKATIRRINDVLLDTIAACGDVNRNVMCTPLAEPRGCTGAGNARCGQAISDHLLPRTRAYHEIWLDGEQGHRRNEDVEPLYGPTYLPRKFKIAFRHPAVNDVDVFAHDLGFIAIVEDGDRCRFQRAWAAAWAPPTATRPPTRGWPTSSASARPEQVLAVAEQVVCRAARLRRPRDRKHARLKYTIDDRGVDWFKAELESRLGFSLAPGCRPYRVRAQWRSVRLDRPRPAACSPA